MNLQAPFQVPFTIKQGRFEGPYTKLLEMIEARKLSISEVSLAQIADDYIAYVRSLHVVDSFDISQFVLVASTLMLIKAKSLLPNLQYTEEEQEQVTTLEKKLELYKVLQEAEKKIKSVWGKRPVFTKEATFLEAEIFTPTNYVTKENIFSIALASLAKMPNFEKLRQVAVRQTLKLEDVIENLITRIGQSTTNLRDFAKTVASNRSDDKQYSETVKGNLIVSFLALLELLKIGRVEAHQDGDDIAISPIA